MPGEFSIVDPETVPTEQFDTCETAVRKLTEPLGCAELRGNRTDDETHVWLAFGAPPVGTVEDFGAYVVADDG
jgi:hypothetical protein